MTNGKYKSLGSVIWKVLRNPIASELTYEEAAEYALEYIRLLGAPLAYLDKLTEPIKLQMHKAELPCDLIELKGIKYSSNDFLTNDGIPLRWASNTYHLDYNDYNDNIVNENMSHEYTYIVQKGIVFVNVAQGSIKIAYKGLALDEEGYPMVPDDEKVILGMEYYILNRYLEPLWLMGKIADKAFEYIQQKRYWYTASASNSLQMLSVDQMETLMNGINRLIINTTAYQNSFKKYGEQERIKKYK